MNYAIVWYVIPIDQGVLIELHVMYMRYVDVCIRIAGKFSGGECLANLLFSSICRKRFGE